MKDSFTEIVLHALRTPVHPIKEFIYIKPLFVRDGRGRFAGKRLRKASTRRIRDKTRLVSLMSQMAANIQTNNALLNRLIGKK